MTLTSYARALAVALLAAGTTAAADAPVPATVAQAVAEPCPTCNHPPSVPCGPACKPKLCPSCIPGRAKPPYQTHLCPGACFGYFQTQWSRWEDVCPLPYQGQGLSDAPALRTSAVAPVRTPAEAKKIPVADNKKDADPKKDMDPKKGELPPPRTDPKGGSNGRSTSLPPIPQAPPTTFPIPTGRFPTGS